MVEHSKDQWWHDDDLLLAALDGALQPTADVPTSFLDTARACYSWHSIDAELAALAYDSADDVAQQAALRSESAMLRALTFEARNLTFELEVLPDGLAGQLVPAQAGELQLLCNGEAAQLSTDRNGYFRIRPLPTAPFRLRCRLCNGQVVLTDLITL